MDHTSLSPEKANGLFERYGTVVKDRNGDAVEYYTSGVIEIARRRIRVSHFPQHILPRQFLPSGEFLYPTIHRQAHFFSTICCQCTNFESIDLYVVGHSHIHTYFYDREFGRLTYSQGGLNDRKSPDEHKAYGIYDTESGIVETISMEEDSFGVVIGSFFTTKLDAVIDESPVQPQVFDLQDPLISGLDPAKLRSSLDNLTINAKRTGWRNIVPK